MGIPKWKQIQQIKPAEPRMRRRMPPSARGRYSKSATGRTSGRDKPENINEKTVAADASMLRGREAIMRFIAHVIKLTGGYTRK